MIDWKHFAEINGLTPSQFEHEVFTAAAALGSKRIDQDDADTLKFTTKDDIGHIELYVRRTKSDNQGER